MRDGGGGKRDRKEFKRMKKSGGTSVSKGWRHPHLLEAYATVWALVRRLPRVHSHVCGQRELAVEAELAHGTHVRPLVCVRCLVPAQEGSYH